MPFPTLVSLFCNPKKSNVNAHKPPWIFRKIFFGRSRLFVALWFKIKREPRSIGDKRRGCRQAAPLIFSSLILIGFYGFGNQRP